MYQKFIKSYRTSKNLKMKTNYSRSNTWQEYNMLRKYAIIILMVMVYLPSVLFAQEEQDTVKVSQEQLDEYNRLKEAAKKDKADKSVEKDGTGNDPRAFRDQWTPFYRYTELENGLIQQDMTAFGNLAFSDYLMVLVEVPLAQYRDFSEVSGLPAGSPSGVIGVGDISLKFLTRSKPLDFSYGEPGEMNKKTGSILIGTDWVLPTVLHFLS